MPRAALDRCRTEPCIAVGGKLSTALPCENCSLLSFCCLRFLFTEQQDTVNHL